jgi:HD-like signal output (HDOD) protein
MIENITERIKTLPPLPKSFHEINTICSSENGTVNQLAKAIEADPMLVANLLKVANSPLYSFRREIRSVLQAISLFGMSTTRALTTDISIKKLLSIDIEPYGVKPEDFVQISAFQSGLMKEWYAKIDNKKLEILFLSALLQETGKILIADEVVKQDEVTPFKFEIETAVDIAQVEKSFVGTTTSEVTSKIFKYWGFDDTMVRAIQYADSYEHAPEDIKEYAFALKVVKTAVPMNAPLSERSVTIALHLIQKEGYNEAVFADAVEKIIENF